jgi:trehalose-phosphatase
MSWPGPPTSSIASSAGKDWGFSLDSHREGGRGFDPAEVVAADVHRRVLGRHLLLLTDFDGTIADIVPTPDEAEVSETVSREFDALAAIDSVTAGVVSGRRLADVRARAGAAAEFVAGLHGLEIAGPDRTFRHPSLDAVAPLIERLTAEAARELDWCAGVELEDKTYALTCHVRRAAPADASRVLRQFAALAEPHLQAHVLRLLMGSKACELLPAADWNKGNAVQWIRAEVERRVARPVSVVYLGDDRTDEEAFAVLGGPDTAIGVGDRPGADLIDWRLAGPAAVGRFFHRLAALRTAQA